MGSSSFLSQYVEHGPFRGLEPRLHAFASPKLYDVFISHRGPDVKAIAALQLYKPLRNIGLQVFFDSNELEFGDFFPLEIQNAIQSARVHIVILSKGYANSPWCLAELFLMLKTEAKIIPVFYDVTRSDLRNINSGVDKNAWAKYQHRYVEDIEAWQEALDKISSIPAIDFSENNHDLRYKWDEIVKAVLEHIKVHIPFLVAKYPVGLDKIVEDFERHCLQERGDNIVGIYGMGGSGKTILAKEVFNSRRSSYHASCFLSDVREASVRGELISLQRQLLKDLYHQNHPIDEGIPYLSDYMSRGRHLRSLIVLDDVDHLEQLHALLGHAALNSGSLVIITSRDQRLLSQAGISARYRIQEMDEESSTQLFCLNAFKQPYTVDGFEDLVKSFVKECSGLPLALQVLGQHVYGRDLEYWNLELEKVKRLMPRYIESRLKISFDMLDDEEKQIFMDITCFFIEKPKAMAITIWRGSGWMAEHALEVLEDKCLVQVDGNNNLRVHNHLRDLGRQMAEVLMFPRRLWRPNDLKCLELKGFHNTICELGNSNVRCLVSMFDESMCSQITCFLGKTDDHVETPTALLWLDICNYGRNFSGIPSWIPLQNLQHLTNEKATSSELEKRNHAVQGQIRD